MAFCKAEAIEFPERHCGRGFISDTRFGPMVHAQLFPGEENSRRLVALLRQKAKEMAEQIGNRNKAKTRGQPHKRKPLI